MATRKSAAATTEFPLPEKGSTVTANVLQPFDGETAVAAIVVKVNDDGSANLKLLAPNGGEDGFVTGVRSKAEVDAMADGADKNAAMTCTWE